MDTSGRPKLRLIRGGKDAVEVDLRIIDPKGTSFEASAVVVQKWEESERGWGNRPDGYSIHLSDADRMAYIEAYWNRMPPTVPDEYQRPCGSPYIAEVTSETFRLLVDAKKEGKLGLRFNDNDYPGSGGPDGWKPAGK